MTSKVTWPFSSGRPNNSEQAADDGACVDGEKRGSRVVALNALIGAIAPLASLEFQIHCFVQGINNRHVLYPGAFIESALAKMNAVITSAELEVRVGPRAKAVIKQCFVELYEHSEAIDFDATTTEGLIFRDPRRAAIRAAAAQAVTSLEAIRLLAETPTGPGAGPAS